MKLNLGPIKGESDASCEGSKQVATDLTNNIQVNNKFGQNIQQRQIQNWAPLWTGTLFWNYVWHQPTHFFDHASKICVLSQTRRAEWFNLTFNRSHWAETGKICSKSHSLQIHSPIRERLSLGRPVIFIYLMGTKIKCLCFHA